MRRGTSLLCTLAVGGLAACIETQTPPEPTKQVTVPYGRFVFLRDATLEERGDRCKLMGVETTTTATSSTSTPTPSLVGGELVEDVIKAWNCYVEVTPGNVTVDQTEVTNAQFQLCVDSGICKKPDPAEVDKLTVCASEDDFDLCPVVSVTQAEATRYCEFTGRRLPSGIESVIIRQANAPQAAPDVQDFPTGNTQPGSCDQAVLKDFCNKPQPITLASDGTPTGAARLDRTTQGVFDLTGNASEWSSDLLPPLRGAAEGLPWFCTERLPDEANPACPSGQVCIYGRYKHPTTGAVGVYPACITDPDLSFSNGSIGSLFGGNYASSTPERGRSGVFARSTRDRPNADSNLGDAGFRCVDAANAPTALAGVPAP